MAPRYSIIRGDFPSDPRADVGHFRVYTLIGRHTDQHGWCRLKQITIGDEVGLSRKTVNLKLKDLVDWGYVEKKDTDATGRAIWYRTIMDAPVAPPVAHDADDDTDCETRDDGASDAHAHPRGGPVTRGLHVGCNSEPTCNPMAVTAGVTHSVTPGVTTGRNTERPSLNDQDSPQPPKGGLSGKSGDEQWKVQVLADLTATGRHRDAVAHLIAPLLASDKRLALGKPSERYAALAELAQQATAIPQAALEAALQRLLDNPHKLTPAAIREEIDRARKVGAAFMARRGTAQHGRWLEYYRKTAPGSVAYAERNDIQVPSEWPPSLAAAERGAA